MQDDLLTKNTDRSCLIFRRFICQIYIIALKFRIQLSSQTLTFKNIIELEPCKDFDKI